MTIIIMTGKAFDEEDRVAVYGCETERLHYAA
jgi:hypothetical protein